MNREEKVSREDILVFSGGFGSFSCFCFHTEMRSVDQWSVVSVAGTFEARAC
jgi:hypothetical protein